MKKHYNKPASAFVTVRLFGHVLEDLTANAASNPTDTFGAREMRSSESDRFDWDAEEEE